MTRDAEPTAPERHPGPTRRWFRLSQETIAIVGSAIALATLILTATGNIRDEARADRAAWEAESRQIRAEAQAHRDAADAQARADREAWERRLAEVTAEWRAESRADREHFQREILRLTGETARLGSEDLPE